MLSSVKAAKCMAPTRARSSHRSVRAPQAAATEAETKDTMGFKLMRRGVKEAAKETILTPRFYTTDFEEMEKILDPAQNPNLDMEEMEALLNEFKTDYNQTHFVRNKTFKEAANNVCH